MSMTSLISVYMGRIPYIAYDVTQLHLYGTHTRSVNARGVKIGWMTHINAAECYHYMS